MAHFPLMIGFAAFHIAGFLLKRASMNKDIVAPESPPNPWALCPFWARYKGELKAVEDHLTKTRGPIDFRQTAHAQIVTAEHVLARAWTINSKLDRVAMVYEEWIYPEDCERVERDIFGPLRTSSQKHSFSMTRHKLHFRWGDKKDN